VAERRVDTADASWGLGEVTSAEDSVLEKLEEVGVDRGSGGFH
jgi:hypothetical protein